MDRKQYLIKVIGVVFYLCIGYYIFSFIKENTDKILNYEFEVYLPFLAIAFLFYALFFSLSVLIWYQMTKMTNVAIGFHNTTKSWIYSQLGKYIPGKVGLFAHRLYSYKSEGKNLFKVSYCLLLEIALNIIAAGVVFATATALIENPSINQYRLWAYSIVAIGLVAVHPKFINLFIELLCKIRKRDFQTVNLGYGQILQLFF